MLYNDKEMGVAWDIPRDGRIRLSFDLGWLGKFVDKMAGLRPHRNEPSVTLKSMMQTIKKFYGKLGELVDFCILDTNLKDSGPVLAIYRPGSSHVEEHQTQDNRLVLVIALYGDLLCSS
jgi:hypothetical protein